MPLGEHRDTMYCCSDFATKLSTHNDIGQNEGFFQRCSARALEIVKDVLIHMIQQSNLTWNVHIKSMALRSSYISFPHQQFFCNSSNSLVSVHSKETQWRQSQTTKQHGKQLPKQDPWRLAQDQLRILQRMRSWSRLPMLPWIRVTGTWEHILLKLPD